MSLNKIKKLKYAISLFFIGIFFLLYELYDKTQKLKISFPRPNNLTQNTSFICESVLYSGIFANSKKYLIGGIEGELSKGNDKIAMTIIDQKTLEFSTAASVSVGITKSDNFLILHNDNEKLIAAWFSDIAISSVVINKKNGLGLWLKGSQTELYDAPNGQVIYLICK